MSCGRCFGDGVSIPRFRLRLSLDEAYLDITENKIGMPSGTIIAREIKVTLKVKYSDFEQITRSRTPGGFITEFGTFWLTAQELLSAVDYSQKPIRLMGLTVSGAQDLDRPEVWQLEFDFGEG